MLCEQHESSNSWLRDPIRAYMIRLLRYQSRRYPKCLLHPVPDMIVKPFPTKVQYKKRPKKGRFVIFSLNGTSSLPTPFLFMTSPAPQISSDHFRHNNSAGCCCASSSQNVRVCCCGGSCVPPFPSPRSRLCNAGAGAARR